MRTQTITRTVYTLQELKEANPRGYEKAMDTLRAYAADHDWWDCVYDAFVTVASHCGWTIGTRRGAKEHAIYFSGFWSQGDGACFAGDWRAADVNAYALRKHAPQDARLQAIGERFAQLARDYPEHTGSVIQSGHYVHSGCTLFDWAPDCESSAGGDAWRSASRALMDWLYDQLEADYYARTSVDALTADAEANGYEFLADGSIA